MLFIDYGNTQEVDVKDLKYLPEACKTKQPQAMECVLAHIQPAFNENNMKGLWSKRANDFVYEKINQAVLCAKVYSVVNDIVNLELYTTLHTNSAILNQILIQRNFAQPAEESYLSKVSYKSQIQSFR